MDADRHELVSDEDEIRGYEKVEGRHVILEDEELERSAGGHPDQRRRFRPPDSIERV